MTADCEGKNQIRDKMKIQFEACQQVERKGNTLSTIKDKTMEPLKVNSDVLSSSTDFAMQKTRPCVLPARHQSSFPVWLFAASHQVVCKSTCIQCEYHLQSEILFSKAQHLYDSLQNNACIKVACYIQSHLNNLIHTETNISSFKLYYMYLGIFHSFS